MGALRLILGDQLSRDMSSLDNVDVANDHVLIAEVRSEASYVKHHKQKIAFLFSAMRHFAASLQEEGLRVTYIDYEHPENQGSLKDQTKWMLERYNLNKVIVAQPAEYRLLEDMKTWQSDWDIGVEITEDNRFLMPQSFFANWAEGRKELRMEYFYREVRKRTGYLMEQGKPVGGKWNYDHQNREAMPQHMQVPKRTLHQSDRVTAEVLTLVEKHFSDHFGSLDNFAFAVTRDQALDVLNAFIAERLPDFGRYQDAMVSGEPWMFHSHISFYLNCGMLNVNEVVDAAIQAYYAGQAPLNSVEGFVRQVIGWREYIRGFYWHFMPELADRNQLEAYRKLPSFFWTADTDMNCLHQCISETRDNAYAHHIQRLMVIGNFALLAGIDPKYVNEWFLIVYADAYEWVEMPNVSSMILYADSGKLASKPYAASGSYIHKMSNYCQSCAYNVKEKTGPQACPFNYLYWDFVARNQERLGSNRRMSMIYSTLSKMDPNNVSMMRDDADVFLCRLEDDEKV
ncbi:cryptochrome/photolyase family protein [Alteromonas facilis]|uniref:cryptochrome/photolyase family protein n=1 Tax=Alteromonas facilis TaxID=2048004 RepID=UPI000C283C3A|nr:cryptochrome/photolyase family protein [Alteromonas facilis]